MKQIASDPVVRLRTVGLVLTLQCNFQCSHCITESTWSQTETIQLEDAHALIDEIACESECICFTGGECLLRKELLIDCMKYAHKKGLNVTMVTNGFWAVDDTVTRNTLKELSEAGLSGLCISFDRFHTPYVSKENSFRIAHLSKEFNLKHVIRICTTKDDAFLENIINENKDTGIRFQIVKTLRLGRAMYLPVNSFEWIENYPEGCCTTVLSPIVLPSGLVQACCGPGIHFNKLNPLNLGDWKEEKLRTILRRSRTSPFVMALHNFGPDGIVKMLNKKNLPVETIKRDKYTGICELCIDICNCPNIVENLEKIFDDEKVKNQLIAGQIYQNAYKYLKTNGFIDLPDII